MNIIPMTNISICFFFMARIWRAWNGIFKKDMVQTSLSLSFVFEKCPCTLVFFETLGGRRFWVQELKCSRLLLVQPCVLWNFIFYYYFFGLYEFL